MSEAVDIPIISKAEASENGLPRYFTGNPCKRGHYSERYTNGGGCIDCLNENTKKRMAEIYKDPAKLDAYRTQCRNKQRRYMSNQEYKDRQNKLRRDAYWNDPNKRQSVIEKNKAWEKENGHKRGPARRRWQSENRHKLAEYGRRYRQKHPGKSSMYTKIYHMKRRQAMPKWANKKRIQDFYDSVAILNKACGCDTPGKTAFHVDHIVPLRGENVSGLHVDYNMQILPAAVNIFKSNKVGV